MINIDLKPLLKKLNTSCTRALEGAAGMCISQGGYEVAIEHMLLKLSEDPTGDLPLIFKHYGLERAHIEASLQRAIEGGRTGNAGKPVFSPLLISWFQEAWLLASVEMGANEIRAGVLLATLLSNPGRYSLEPYMESFAPLPAEDLKRRFRDITAGSSEEPAIAGTQENSEESSVAIRAAGTALARFTLDFTGRAQAGEIDPVFGREREIRQLIDILGRRRKNNPIAVGEAGVGKTALVEGLALKVVQKDVPEFLQSVAIYGLDLGLLQAGAGVKGEFENRLKAVIEEVKASPKPVILFIDEAHTLIGAGGTPGGSDAANLLKPALARGELRTIAATTWSEYKKYFEQDPALARRFQLVKLDEPSPQEAALMLRGVCAAYEAAHGVYVHDDAVEAAAKLSARYLSGRQLPDKAVDVLDTACARVRLSLTAKPDTLDDKERRIQSLQRELQAIRRDIAIGARAEDEKVATLETAIRQLAEEAVKLGDRWRREQVAVERVLELRQRLAQVQPDNGAAFPQRQAAPAEISSEATALRRDLAGLLAELQALQARAPLIHYEVTPEVVAKVVADWTGVPLGKMVRDEARSILELEPLLKTRIKGQDSAIEAVARGMRAAKAGLENPHRPLGVFLLVGPSGVGKTECGLAIADLLFGGERFMVTINMSEFQEKHTVSRLIGSPPGYVGYREGGKLTEAVRQRPYCVVLLDEVEKADREVMNLFYQVFDKGVLSDGEGRLIDFKNTVIFLTSNLASELITAWCAREAPPSPEAVREAIWPVLSNHFKPALLARMEIVPFFTLPEEALQEIVELKLAQLGERLRESHKLNFLYQPEVVTQIAQRCTEVETGARNVDYLINRTLLPRLATLLLERIGGERTPDTLEIGIDSEREFTWTFRSQD
jgi:type VI secretion system protein VasG